MDIVPIKKKDVPSNSLSKKFFWLVLPFLFPGFYGDDNKLAFRTWLALAGTCRRLRYWETLRRWIGYVVPQGIGHQITLHGFPRRLLLSQLRENHEIAVQPLVGSRHFQNFHFVCFSSYLLDVHNNSQFQTEKIGEDISAQQIFQRIKSNFDCTVAEIPFFNCVSVWANQGDQCKHVLVYLAPSFAEMVLFCYAAMADTTDHKTEQWYCSIPLWKHKEGDNILFSKEKRGTFLKKSLLGKLRRIGNTAPLDFGFVCGSLKRTAFSHFMDLCDTSGSKVHTTPKDRLESFVRQWFKQDVFARTETEKVIYALHEDEPHFY